MFGYGSAQNSHLPRLGSAVPPHSHPQCPGASTLLKSNKKRADQAWSQNSGGKPPLLISRLPSISLLAPSPAWLHPGEPAAACRRKRPCHGCLRRVIVSVTLQIPFPCGGPGGVINGGGKVRTLPINRTPAPPWPPRSGWSNADGIYSFFFYQVCGLGPPDPGSEMIDIHSHPTGRHKSPWKYSTAVVWGGQRCLQPLAAQSIINHLVETRLLKIDIRRNCWVSPIISLCVWLMLLPGGSLQPSIVFWCIFPAQLAGSW